MNSRIENIGRRVLQGERLSRPELLWLSQACGQDLWDLFYWAGRVRAANFDREVKFCSIAAGKVGACSEDCKWCAQSACYSAAPAQKLQRATTAELTQAAREAIESSVGSFGIVNSGRRPSEKDLAALQEAIEAVESRQGSLICASLGELDDSTAARLYDMGVRRYNHNLETSRRFYSQVVTSHGYDHRLATLRAARKAGITLCCGGIFGLGETWEDRVDMALTLRDDVAPEVTPINFLYPIAGTPLEKNAMLTPMECLHIIALFRLALPKVDLKIAGGRLLNLRELQSWMFHVGATSCIVGNCLTTIGRDVATDRQLLADLGLTLVKEFSREASDQPATCEQGATGA